MLQNVFVLCRFTSREIMLVSVQVGLLHGWVFILPPDVSVTLLLTSSLLSTSVMLCALLSSYFSDK